MNVDLTPVQVLAGFGGALALLLLWRSGVRRARAAADAARHGARVVSLAGRVIGTAGLIVGIEWVVVTRTDDHLIQVVVLALPALFAAHTLVRALTVTTLDTYRRPRGERRW